MAKDVVITQEDFLAAKIFFNSALPLLKVICESEPKFGNKFKGKNFVFQVSAKYPTAKDGVLATYFVVEDGKFTVKVNDVHPKPDIEFAFPNLRKFNIFFSGKGMPLPKIKGFSKLGTLVGILMTLLRMAGLLQLTEIPKEASEQEMLVKLYFYLLPNGISQLNKFGYEPIQKWAKASPDRAYALAVEGKEDVLSSYLRVADGNTKAGRGIYQRSKPFLTMSFDNCEHALNILMSKGDMVDYIANKYLNILGAPEFGSTFGDFMMQVGYFAQGKFLEKYLKK